MVYHKVTRDGVEGSPNSNNGNNVRAINSTGEFNNNNANNDNNGVRPALEKLPVIRTFMEDVSVHKTKESRSCPGIFRGKHMLPADTRRW